MIITERGSAILFEFRSATICASIGSSTVGAGPGRFGSGAAAWSCVSISWCRTAAFANAAGPSVTTRTPPVSNFTALGAVWVETKCTDSVSVVMSRSLRSTTRWIAWSCIRTATRSAIIGFSVASSTCPLTGRLCVCWKRATACTVAASITPLTGTPTCCWIIRTDCWSYVALKASASASCSGVSAPDGVGGTGGDGPGPWRASSAACVSGPTIPSGTSSAAFWKSTVAPWVSGPKIPSTASGGAAGGFAVLRRLWTSDTAGPREPRRTIGRDGASTGWRFRTEETAALPALSCSRSTRATGVGAATAPRGSGVAALSCRSGTPGVRIGTR